MRPDLRPGPRAPGHQLEEDVVAAEAARHLAHAPQPAAHAALQKVERHLGVLDDPALEVVVEVEHDGAALHAVAERIAVVGRVGGRGELRADIPLLRLQYQRISARGRPLGGLVERQRVLRGIDRRRRRRGPEGHHREHAVVGRPRAVQVQVREPLHGVVVIPIAAVVQERPELPGGVGAHLGEPVGRGRAGKRAPGGEAEAARAGGGQHVVVGVRHRSGPARRRARGEQGAVADQQRETGRGRSAPRSSGVAKHPRTLTRPTRPTAVTTSSP